MEDNEFQQQELFETEKYISDLVEEKTKRKTSTFNIIFLSSFFTSIIVLSFLFFFGVFDDEEITLPDPVTCLLYTSPSPRDGRISRMPSSA